MLPQVEVGPAAVPAASDKADDDDDRSICPGRTALPLPPPVLKLKLAGLPPPIEALEAAAFNCSPPGFSKYLPPRGAAVALFAAEANEVANDEAEVARGFKLKLEGREEEERAEVDEPHVSSISKTGAVAVAAAVCKNEDEEAAASAAFAASIISISSDSSDRSNSMAASMSRSSSSSSAPRAIEEEAVAAAEVVLRGRTEAAAEVEVGAVVLPRGRAEEKDGLPRVGAEVEVETSPSSSSSSSIVMEAL